MVTMFWPHLEKVVATYGGGSLGVCFSSLMRFRTIRPILRCSVWDTGSIGLQLRVGLGLALVGIVAFH